MIWAHVCIGSVTLDAFGNTRSLAFKQLEKAWDSYCRNREVDQSLVAEDSEAIEYHEVSPTKSYFLVTPDSLIQEAK